jgi:hypothetical protein
MTDTELVAAITRIVNSRPRLDKRDRHSFEARDLARYDQIAGLIARRTPDTNGGGRRRRRSKSTEIDVPLPLEPDEAEQGKPPCSDSNLPTT